MARILSTWFSIRASYWFYPALFAIAAFVLALVTIQIDRSGAAAWLSDIPELHPARPDGASNMLTVLAGSMIGVASTVFSITIAAVAYASGNYGPRLLTNFMEDKGNQFSLATFIGTFVYALTVLRTVRSEDESPLLGATADSAPGFVPQLSLLVAFALMLVAVAVLVFFLHHIPSSIRINFVLEGIGKRLLGKVDHLFPDDFERDAGLPDSPDGAAVEARDTGYVRVIDFDELADCADDKDMRIGLRLRTGDFVHPGKPLVATDMREVDDEIAGRIRDCFALGGSRTPEQDIEFSLDELVEIALRALSPGINDPFTAISAIHWIGAATARLGARDLRNVIKGEDGVSERVVPLADDFAHFLKRGFGAVRVAIASSKIATLKTFDALADAAHAIDDADRRAQVEGEARALLEQAEHQQRGPEIEDIRARFREISEAFEQRKSSNDTETDSGEDR
ncbi:MAG: DUF2254 domain-containing protein [Sphingomonadaceae bacterium]